LVNTTVDPCDAPARNPAAIPLGSVSLTVMLAPASLVRVAKPVRMPRLARKAVASPVAAVGLSLTPAAALSVALTPAAP